MPHAFLNGIWINYRELGEGEPILFLMGLGAPLEGWDLQVPVFARNNRVVVLDNRGVGRSEKPFGRYSIAQMVEDARCLIDHLGIEQTHVVGLSMGGMIAMELAARYPARVRSLVLASTAAAADAKLRWTVGRGAVRVTAAMVRAGGGLETRMAAAQEETIRVWTPLVFSDSLEPAQATMLRQLMEAAFAEGYSTTGTAGQLAAVVSHDARARLRDIAAQTLVLGGTADAIFGPAHFQNLAYSIGGAHLELLDGAPHGINFAAPAYFNETILRFLGKSG